MPTVPQYGGPQIATRQLQTVQQGQIDVSSGLQQGARALGEVAQVADRAADRMATDEAFQLETKLKSDWLTTDAELRKKYRGNNVAGYEAEVEKWWADAPKSYGANASPQAQQKANRSINSFALQSRASAMAYQTAEQERALDQNYAAGQGVTIQGGLRDLTPVTAGPIASATLSAINDSVSRYGATKGWSTEQVQAEQLRQSDGFHRAAIAQLVDTDAAAAKAYYSTYREQISGAHYAQIDRAVDNAFNDQEGKRVADGLATLPYAEQLAKTAEIADPALREKARLHVKQNRGDIVAADQAREKAASDQAWQMVGAGKRVPEAVLGGMDGRERVQLQDYLRQRAEHAATQGRKPVATDPTAHAELWEMATRDPAKFRDTRLAAYGMKVGQSDLEQLYKMQQTMLNPKSDKDPIAFNNNKVTARLELLGIASGANDQEKRGVFRSAAQREFEAFAARTGKGPNPKEEDAILDALMLPGKTPWFSGNAKTYGESVAAGKPFVLKNDADYDKLPPGARFVAPDGTTRVKP